MEKQDESQAGLWACHTVASARGRIARNLTGCLLLLLVASGSRPNAPAGGSPAFINPGAGAAPSSPFAEAIAGLRKLSEGHHDLLAEAEKEGKHPGG